MAQPDFGGGTELRYSVEGALEAVATVVGNRLEEYDATTDAEVVDGLLRVRVVAEDRERVPAVKELVTRAGGLEFRITVEPSATEHYAAYWNAFRGEGARDVAPAPGDRARYPDGLRWYPVAEGAPLGSRVMRAERAWMLCALDPHDITEEALYAFRAAHSGYGDEWVVDFRVKKLFQGSLAALTEFEHDKYMAIIVDGEVHRAPILNTALAEAGRLSCGSEEAARRLAATLASGRLPAIPALVSETPIPE